MSTNTFLLIIFLKLASVLAISKPPQCRNSEGKPVDWWFIYKENTGMRYVYYDSIMAIANNTKKHIFRPMSDTYTLDNRRTSPLLHTMYAPFEAVEKSGHEDLWSKPVFVAVNDQPAQKEGKNIYRDAFKKPVSDKSGHVKFITAAQVEYGANDDATIYSYLIQHSLPKFPNMSIEGTGTRERIFANELPPKADVFGSNALSNGQHFMCMSFKDKQELDDKPEVASTRNSHMPQLKYRRAEIGEYLKSGNHHFICILHYLKVVHGVVVGTNYDPFDIRFGVFHQYLNVYEKWSSLERREQKTEKNDNMGRTSLARKYISYDSTHLCPMWPLNRRVRLDRHRKPESVTYYEDKKFEIFSMRSSGESGTGVCQVFDIDEPDQLCLASAKLVSTAAQLGIEGVLLMKGSHAELGPFDDLIAPLVVELGDYGRAAEVDDLEESVTMNMGLIAQSWIDHATLPISTKTLFKPESSLQVSLTLQNSAGVHLPVKNYPPHFMPSLGQDHSKWALAVPRGSVGTFPNLFRTLDLNRTYKQERRGGGMLCFSDHVFTELMLSLRPDVSAKFISKQVEYSKLSHLYDGFTQLFGTAVKIAIEDDGPSPVFFLATQRTIETTCIHKMPYPFEGDASEAIAIPDVSWNNKDLKHGVQLELVGDIKVEQPKRPEDPKNIAPYYATKSVNQPPFYTGLRLKTSGITAAVVDGLLSVSTKFWTHAQQLYHTGSGMGSDFTATWLKDFFTSLPEEKLDAPTAKTRVVVPAKKR